MGPDYDDVGALTLLHAFADSGKAEILATMASNNYALVAPSLEVINTYYLRPTIPVGVPKTHGVNIGCRQHWTDSIVARFPPHPGLKLPGSGRVAALSQNSCFPARFLRCDCYRWVSYQFK